MGGREAGGEGTGTRKARSTGAGASGTVANGFVSPPAAGKPPEGRLAHSAGTTVAAPTRRGMCRPNAAITALTAVNAASPYSPPE